MSQRSRLKPPQKCIYCGNYGGMSKEHVIADWVRALFPKANWEGNAHIEDAIAPDESLQLARTNLESRKREGHVLSVKLKKVCQKCNNGWLSRIDERAKYVLKPLILKADNVVLSETDKKTIALWAVKTAMTNEFSYPDRVVTPFSERQYLKDNQVPPDSWRIWILPYKGTGWNTIRLRYALLAGVGPLISGTPIRPIAENGAVNTQSTFIGLGGVILYAFSSAISDLQFGFNADGSTGKLIQLWPPIPDNSLWMRTHALTDGEATYVAHALPTAMAQNSLWVP